MYLLTISILTNKSSCDVDKIEKEEEYFFFIKVMFSPNTLSVSKKVNNQANRGTGKNMATLNNKFIFFALTSEC
jgi:hypothetical protein